ncbi:transposase (plasmid) [Mycolicibacterium psychrotolerans]|uniref:transposase n=1 Tax=Mycolicibacterium psychrotolerans TaxID=216929 RepID=UPI003D66BD3C
MGGRSAAAATFGQGWTSSDGSPSCDATTTATPEIVGGQHNYASGCEGRQRDVADRRAVARYAGLASRPQSSGTTTWGHGDSRGGNRVLNVRDMFHALAHGNSMDARHRAHKSVYRSQNYDRLRAGFTERENDEWSSVSVQSTLEPTFL